MFESQRRRKLAGAPLGTLGAKRIGAELGSPAVRAALHVLLVEDDPNDELIIRTFLQRSKHFECEIVWVSDLASARDAAKIAEFDVIILDFWVQAEDSLAMLSKMDGAALSAPVVVVTSLDMTDIQAASLEAGALSYLHKSDLSVSALDATLRTMLHSRAKEETLTRSLAQQKSKQERIRDNAAEMAHEIMNTLNAVHGFAEIMTSGPAAALQASSRAYPELIKDGSARLIEILQRYLASVGTQEIASELRYESACIIDTIEAAATALEKRCAAKRQAIDIVATSDEIRAEFDKTAVYQLVVNLLVNAHKYSNDGSPIRITIDDLGSEVKFSVIDQGVGMSERQIHLALQRYSRIVAPAELAAGGSGLGLAIVTSIVDMHGGTLEIESFKDWGTTVAIRLPKRRPTLN